MFKHILFSLFFVCLLSACSQSTTQDASSNNPNQFGDPITQEGSITYDALLQKLSSTDSLNTKVSGTVSAVCKKKGCWMTIVSEDSDQEMRVKFKDYGFFVPMDIEGRKVIFEGKAFKEITPVDELRHYAEDAGKSTEEIAQITTPEEDYKFLASGVLLVE